MHWCYCTPRLNILFQMVIDFAINLLSFCFFLFSLLYFLHFLFFFFLFLSFFFPFFFFVSPSTSSPTSLPSYSYSPLPLPLHSSSSSPPSPFSSSSTILVLFCFSCFVQYITDRLWRIIMPCEVVLVKCRTYSAISIKKGIKLNSMCSQRPSAFPSNMSNREEKNSQTLTCCIYQRLTQQAILAIQSNLKHESIC